MKPVWNSDLRAGRAHALLNCLVLILFAMVGATTPIPAIAHEMRPAYLEITEAEPATFDVLFKTPMIGDARLALSPIFSGDVEAVTPIVSRPTGDAMIQTWRMKTTEPLAGQAVRIDGLDSTLTDALVRIKFADGNIWVERLTPRAPAATIPSLQTGLVVAVIYVRQGIEHILFGFDHLLFVASLMLIVRDWRMLVKTITAFTLAHSITLTLATLGWVTLPVGPVETMIAFSIVLVAVEIVRMERGERSLTVSRPWVVAFAFGLLHGFGFAGALIDLGLPRGDIPLALLSFNVGVEIGQLAFIAVSLAVVAGIRQFFTIPRRSIVAIAYAIGTVAMFWALERLQSTFL